MAQNGADDSFYNSVDGAHHEYDPTGAAAAQEALSADEAERLQREEQMKCDLAKLEEEIGTLKTVLNSKVAEAAEIRRKLGITTMVVLKEDLKHGLQVIKESETVQKTNEKLHQIGETIAATDAYQKTNTALKSFGAYASRKMGDLKNSNAFKSVEGRVGGAYTSMKRQVSGGVAGGQSGSEDSFDEVIRQQGQAEEEEERELEQLSEKPDNLAKTDDNKVELV